MTKSSIQKTTLNYFNKKNGEIQTLFRFFNIVDLAMIQTVCEISFRKISFLPVAEPIPLMSLPTLLVFLPFSSSSSNIALWQLGPVTYGRVWCCSRLERHTFDFGSLARQKVEAELGVKWDPRDCQWRDTSTPLIRDAPHGKWATCFGRSNLHTERGRREDSRDLEKVRDRRD